MNEGPRDDGFGSDDWSRVLAPTSAKGARKEAWRLAGRALGEAGAPLQGLKDDALARCERLAYDGHEIEHILELGMRLAKGHYYHDSRIDDMVELGHFEECGRITLWARINESMGEYFEVEV